MSEPVKTAVIYDTMIRILLVMMLLAKYNAEVVDAKGSFLYVYFDDGEIIHMKVPVGLEKYYQEYVILYYCY